jgi:hypothetical protein
VTGALIGRDADVRAVRAVVADTAAGRGGVAVVLGEAGIGKSRLLDAVVAEIGDLPVLRGWAAAGNGPYRAVAEAVRDLPAPGPICGRTCRRSGACVRTGRRPVSPIRSSIRRSCSAKD